MSLSKNPLFYRVFFYRVWKGRKTLEGWSQGSGAAGAGTMEAADNSTSAGAAPDKKCFYYCRILLALLATVFVLVGVSMQAYSASNLYGVPLETQCTAYSGTPAVSDTESFKELIKEVIKERKYCLTRVGEDPAAPADCLRSGYNNTAICKCCLDHSPPGTSALASYFHGICAKPWLAGVDLNNDTGLDAAGSLELFTSILGDFIGVKAPNHYETANAEFWCKNCPNDYRSNCPFDPPASNSDASGAQAKDLCQCPGGMPSRKGEPYWAMVTDSQLSGRYVRCADQAKVFRSWMEALFENKDWGDINYALTEKRFYNTCFSRKGTLGFILSVGPVLAIFSCVFTLFSLLKYCATTGLPNMAFNLVLLSLAMTLISFWPLSFTGASALVARYAFCWGMQDSQVVNASSSLHHTFSAPRLFTGQPCYDMDSEGDHSSNPFVEQLGVYGAGYVTGGVLMILAEIIMLALVSKHTDVVLEVKLARKDNDAGGSSVDTNKDALPTEQL